MKIGFTGTRFGMQAVQRRILFALLHDPDAEFHHGLCVGSDEEAHELAMASVLPIIGHPPIDQTHMAAIDRATFAEMREPKLHLARNRDIVNETDSLIATPRDMEPQSRGGTWFTIRFAQKAGKRVTIIWPNGSLDILND